MFSDHLVDLLERVETSPALLRLKMLELQNTLEDCREQAVRDERVLVLDALRRKIMLQPDFSLADLAAKLKTYNESAERADGHDSNRRQFRDDLWLPPGS